MHARQDRETHLSVLPSLVLSSYVLQSNRTRDQWDLVDNGLLTTSLHDVDDEKLLRVSSELEKERRGGGKGQLEKSRKENNAPRRKKEAHLNVELARSSLLEIEAELGDVSSSGDESSLDLLLPGSDGGLVSSLPSLLVDIRISREGSLDVLEISDASRIRLVVVVGSDVLRVGSPFGVVGVSISGVGLDLGSSEISLLLDRRGEVLVDGSSRDSNGLPLSDSFEIVLEHLADLLEFSEDLVPDVKTERGGEGFEDLVRSEVVLLEVLLLGVEVEKNGVGP